MLHSQTRVKKLITDKRKKLTEEVFTSLKSAEDRAKFLLLIQTYKDEIEDLYNE